MPVKKSYQKEKAHYLYMNTSMLQKDIADAARVTRKTVNKWIKTEHWATQKRATYYSPEQILNQLFEELRIIDQNINLRDAEKRFATKEENEQRTKLLTLISGHMKNSPGNWRNIAPDHDYSNAHMVDLNALGALERKNLEKRIAAAEEDARLGPGERFSEEKMDKYYSVVAMRSFGADSMASKVGDDGKPLPPDDPQRLKWEEMMRQGKRPFRRRNDETESEEQSGKEGDEEEHEEQNESDGDVQEQQGRQEEQEDEDDTDDNLVPNDANLPPGWTWEMMLNDEDPPGSDKDEKDETGEESGEGDI